MRPHNWKRSSRLLATGIVSLTGGALGYASAIAAGVTRDLTAAFGGRYVVEALATVGETVSSFLLMLQCWEYTSSSTNTLFDIALHFVAGIFLVGFGFDAGSTGPISEVLGRGPVYIPSLAIYMLFIMGAGLSRNSGTLIVCRFFAAIFGPSTAVCVGGSLADMFARRRVYAFPFYACYVFIGILFGGIPGHFIGKSKTVSLHQASWTMLCVSGLVILLVIYFQSETTVRYS